MLKDFINYLIKIMLDNKCKANVDFLLYNRTDSVMYDIKITKLGQFSDLGMF